MGQLMADSDMVIGAAGATAWERCCLGVPSLMLVLADNQTNIARALADAGAAIFSDLDRVQCVLEETFDSELGLKLKQLSRSSANVTDGLGSTRVCLKLSLVD